MDGEQTLSQDGLSFTYGLPLSSATAGTVSPLREYAERLQEKFDIPQIFPLEISPYVSKEALITLLEKNSNNAQLKGLGQKLERLDAFIIGWDQTNDERQFVLAVKVRCSAHDELRPIWKGEAGAGEPIGAILGLLPLEPALQTAQGEFAAGSVRVLLLEPADFDSLHELRDPNKRTQRLQATKGAPLQMAELFTELVTHAVHNKASDLHIFPVESGYRVELRVDGEIQRQEFVLPYRQADQLVNYIKTRANKRTDFLGTVTGGIALDESPDHKLRGINGLNIRFETIPTVSRFPNAQTLTMRFQTSLNAKQFDLERLGYTPSQLAAIRRVLDAPDGLILLTGPTGSGKTTTLYSCLQYLNNGRNRIFTAEDPTELRFEGITQTSINEATGLTFSNLLRSFLRSDPDVIMIGEMRDQETAKIGIEAVTTGHQVLSTLHTPSAVAVAVRLRELGVEPSQLSNALAMVVAQRLVRVFAPEQAKRLEEYDARSDLNRYFGAELLAEPVKLLRPYSGTSGAYRGRTCVSEIWVPSEATRSLLARAESEQFELRRAAIAKDGLEPLFIGGLRLVLEGRTSMAEMLRSAVSEGDLREHAGMIAEFIRNFKRPV